MTLDLLYTIIVCAILWVSSVVILVLYIRLAWSNRIYKLEKIVREMDWRIATNELRCIRIQEEFNKREKLE